MERFRGKAALVTGAAGGIGAAIVRQLRAEGAIVAVADRDVSGIEAEARFAGDLLDPAYVRHSGAKTANSRALSPISPIPRVPPQQWRQWLAVPGGWTFSSTMPA